jgi:hypothetical protein
VFYPVGLAAQHLATDWLQRPLGNRLKMVVHLLLAHFGDSADGPITAKTLKNKRMFGGGR